MSFSSFANKTVRAADMAQSTMDRSVYPKRWSWKGTFNFGDIIPLHWEMIYPSDSLDKVRTNVLARMATPLYPVMDNAYIDFYYFFVPMRLVWDHWKEMFGENNENAWIQDAEYLVPSLTISGTAPSAAFSVWDYLGLPVLGSGGYVPGAVSALPFRGYRLICNEWFRNQNVSAPLLVNTGDVENDGTLLNIQKSCRFHDYFSDCLPAPQKGPDTLIPGIAEAPITTTSSEGLLSAHPGLRLRVASNGTVPSSPATLSIGLSPSSNLVTGVSAVSTSGSTYYFPTNLAIDASSPGYTISALRTAFQIQGILERDARSGSRYTEYVRAAFKTISPDARLQRPEFLGTSRMPLNIQQVVQTSEVPDQSTPLGSTGAMSKSVHSFSIPRHGFTEHGMVFVLCTARTERSYQNRIDRKWQCFSRFDFYDPALAHISEQPVYTRELAYFTATENNVFGYNEAWQFLRENQNVFTGAFRSNAANSLDSWHYGDNYSSSPILSESWMLESPDQVERTLAVGTPDNHSQILMDVFFDWTMTRPIPVHSIPGLVDHF